jgi:hypothetical protein
MAVAGGIATYYYLTKNKPNSEVVRNPYYLAGVVLLGVVAGAYVSSYVKSVTKNPTAL